MPEDLFVQNISGDELASPPPEKQLRKSQCTPLFMCAYRERAAGAVIHTHSKHALLATLLFPGTEFRCSHLEMIKVCKEDMEKMLITKHYLTVGYKESAIGS